MRYHSSIVALLLLSTDNLSKRICSLLIRKIICLFMKAVEMLLKSDNGQKYTATQLYKKANTLAD